MHRTDPGTGCRGAREYTPKQSGGAKPNWPHLRCMHVSVNSVSAAEGIQV